jgi:hypothetical protein
LAIGQQKRPGGNLPKNNFPGTSEVGCSADGSRAARHGPVMKFGAEVLVAAQAKSMLKQNRGMIEFTF